MKTSNLFVQIPLGFLLLISAPAFCAEKQLPTVVVARTEPQGIAGWQPAIGPRAGSREGSRDARPRNDNAPAGDRRPTADRAFAARSENRRDPGAPARNYGPKKGGNSNYRGTVKRAV